MKHRRRTLRRRFGHMTVGGRKIVASSFQRYNGGVRIKRLHGSSTVTRFYVHWAEDRNDPSKWEEIEGYGASPGERKTYAIHEFLRSRGHGPYVEGGGAWR